MNLATISDELELADEGIWFPRHTPQETISFPLDGHAECLQIEESSFWFRHRNTCLLELLSHYPPAGTIFELGAGNGFVAAAFENAGYPTVALEPASSGARNAKLRGVRTVVCSTLASADFKVNTLPAIGLFDVIEHIEADEAVLCDVARALVPGGRVYISVPAYKWLWSDEDRVAGHFRRYTLGRLRRDVERAGLSVEYASYIFSALVPPVFLFRTLPSLAGRRSTASSDRTAAQHSASNGVLSRLVTAALSAELRALRSNRSLPFGASCVLVARKSA